MNTIKRRVYLLLAIVLFLLGIGILIYLFSQLVIERKANKLFEQMKNEYVIQNSEELEKEIKTDSLLGTNQQTESGFVSLNDENTPENMNDPNSQEELLVPDMLIDWEVLQAQNEDIYAWIVVPGTRVSYPVLQHDTMESYYLDHNLDGSLGKPGCIYTQYLNNKDFNDSLTVVYGHNMKNKTMFGSLHQFEEESFFKSNKDIFVYTPEKQIKYQIFAALEFGNAHLLNSFDYKSQEGMDTFLQAIMTLTGEHVWVDRELPVDGTNQIMVLSTCMKNQSENRYLILAKKLGERTSSTD